MMIKLTAIFITFVRVGAFTLGGGYAMFSLLRYELIAKRGWLSEEEFTQELAMATSLPGAMVINFSLFCGARLRGRAGALAAFLGTVLPSFLIIIVAAAFLFPYFKHPAAAAFLRGAAAVVAGLLAHTAVTLCKPMISQVSHAVAALVAAGIALLPAVNPIFALILVSAAVYLLSINKKVKSTGGINTVSDSIIHPAIKHCAEPTQTGERSSPLQAGSQVRCRGELCSPAVSNNDNIGSQTSNVHNGDDQ